MTRDSSEADGGWYHGSNHVYYGSGSCPKCDGALPEFVPIPQCETSDVDLFEQVSQVVHCACGQTYKAIYDWGSGEVTVSIHTRQQAEKLREDYLNEHRN